MPASIGTIAQAGPITTRPISIGRTGPGVNGGVQRKPDSVSFSSVGRELGQLSTLLGRLRSAVRVGTGGATGRAQLDLDATRDQLQSLDDTRALGGRAVTIKSSDVLASSFFTLSDEGSDPIGVEVTVTQSAQPGGLFLNLGANRPGEFGTIDLATGSSFTIELVGPGGSRRLSFASSQTLGQITAAINAFSATTGIEAVVSGYGVKLKTQAFGGQEFVSVSVIEGSLRDRSFGAAGDLGVYELNPDDFGAASDDVISFLDAASPVVDLGQDVAATVNGRQAVATGNVIAFLDQPFGGLLELSTGAASDPSGVNAQNLGTFLAAILDPQPGLESNGDVR